jgi:uncharacterized protein
MTVKESGRSARPAIERYGPGGFVIDGATYEGPVLILQDRVLAWDIPAYEALTPEHFRLAAERGGIELLLFGTGKRMRMVSRPIKDALKAVGITVDAMDTGAACQTYGVLTAELRRVAAALLPLRD